MNTSSFGAAARQPAAMAADEPSPTNLTDAAWMVLEAANDLGDDATIAACRRVIDASLNHRPASPYDLHVVLNYFR